MKYTTDYNYTSREDKMFYVYKKYKSILDGKKIIDIGADRGYLRQHLPDTSSYTNIGFGPDILRGCPACFFDFKRCGNLVP